jgi:hypothetical protein
MNRKLIGVAVLMLGVTAGVVWSQEATPQQDAPATPQAATSPEDPDALSAEESETLSAVAGGGRRFHTWSEFIEFWMAPRPFDKKYVVRIDENYALPHIVAGIKMEFVREDEEHIWLRGIPPEDPNSMLHKIWVLREAENARIQKLREAENTPGALNYVDFQAIQVPPPSMESLRFERAATALPEKGFWQMGFAVADMNVDGHPDLVFPPERKSYDPRPAIFFGDGKGGFAPWEGEQWPEGVPWDYGGVAAGDFNQDGHPDLVFAIHFKGQYILYGDGRGGYPFIYKLPSPDPRITSRAVVAGDFDGDGGDDLAFIAEVDYDLTTGQTIEGSATTWALFNRGEEGWEVNVEGLPTGQIADVIRAADLDGDGRAEIIVSSNTIAKRSFVYRLGEQGWQASDPRGVLSSAYHYSVEPVGNELIATFVQFRRIGSATEARNGLVRYPPPPDGQEFVVGTPLVWDKERSDVYFRIGVGDLDGDGHTDLVAGRRNGGLEVFLQTGDGFSLERGDELDRVGRAYMIRLLDLDGNGLDDIVAGFTPQGDLPGGIYVWLSKPTA